MKPLKLSLEDPFELNEDFEEVPLSVLSPSLWHDVFSIHMQHAEHIALLESRGVIASLRHKLRAKRQFGLRHLHFNDNMGVVLMCSKGRSGSYAMLRT